MKNPIPFLQLKYINPFLLIVFILISSTGSAQIVTNIPSPAGFNTGSQSGYEGLPVIYNGNLYLRYHGNDLSSSQLFKYDGNDLIEIPAPSDPNGYLYHYVGAPVVYDNHLYLKYQNRDGDLVLFKFNGIDLVQVSNPPGFALDGSRVFPNASTPIVFGNKLYIRYEKYENSFLKNYLYKYDGNHLTQIPLPTGFIRCSGDPFVFNNNLYIKYEDDNYNTSLFKYDGANLIEIPSPNGFSGDFSGYNQPLTIYNDNLYLKYNNDNGNGVLFKHDGANLVEIPSPNGFQGRTKGLRGLATVFRNNLYLRYDGDDNNADLFKYDGANLTEIPSPTGFNIGSTRSGGNGYLGHPMVYNNDLYLYYIGDSIDNYQSVLFKYDEANLTEIPSPSNKLYFGYPIVFDDNMYLSYFDTISRHFDLLKYDDAHFTEIVSPSLSGIGFVRSSIFPNPILFNNDLYLQYTNNDRSRNLVKLSTMATGIDKLTTTDIVIYPNPVKNNLTIDLGSTDNVALSIKTIQGQLIYNNSLNNNKLVVNTENWSKGIYILNLKNNAVNKTFQFVKQ